MLAKFEVSPDNAGLENHTLIAKSPLIQEKLAIVNHIAGTDSSILFLGESGTGKNIFAERTHLSSSRSGKPFIRINCAAVSAKLFEHKIFELADGGTIFFDGITEIPLANQTELLRLIQDRAELRILAASVLDIEKQVEKGEFNGDLYHRLNVLPLFIPPLRQRQEDIPELAAFFLAGSMKKTGKHFDGFSDEAMEAMLAYSWPGNVRELKNSVERACLIAKEKLIETDDIFPASFPMAAFGRASAPKDGSRNLKAAENIFRTRFIRKVLEENHWNQTEAARVLGIQRTYLSRLIKELDINNPKE